MSRSRPGWVSVVPALLLLLALAGPAQAIELDDVFPRAERSRPQPSAEELVRAAFDNLFGFDVAVRVESLTRQAGTVTARLRFWLCRKRFGPDTTRVVVATRDDTADPRPTRMLQIDRGQGRIRSRLYAPQVDPEPMSTSYRLTDPFLGAFSDRDAPEVRADLSELVRAHEIVSLDLTRMGDAAVHRVGLRPLSARRYERVELLIAVDEPLILEYRYFEIGDPRASRVAQAPRAEMRTFEGHVLPGRMLYQDRIQQTETELTLRYEPLPNEGDALFMESSFHRAPMPGFSEEDASSR